MTTVVCGPPAVLIRNSPEWSWALQNPGPQSVDVGRDSIPVLIKILLDGSGDPSYEKTRQSLFRFCFFICMIFITRICITVLIVLVIRITVFFVGNFVVISMAMRFQSV